MGRDRTRTSFATNKASGSASYTGSAERRSRYNLYEIARGAITRITRAHDEPSHAFREVRRERLV